MRLLRSIATIGAYTSISRVLGFVRDVLIAALLGAGPVADAFFVALRFPNMFRALFAEGAFSAAFVPIFVTTREGSGMAAARAVAQDAFAVLAAALCVFVLAMELAMPVAVLAIAPGFAGTPTFELAVTFSRLTFPYLLFISLTALCAGVLNSLGRFASPAAAPILLNVSLIGAMLGPSPLFPTLGHALAWAVVVAGVLQFLWLWVHCGLNGLWLKPARPRLTPKVRLLLRRALPVAFGAGVHQVNILVDTVLASTLALGSVSYLFYADRLSQLPYGIIAAAVSTALLPVLAREVRAGDTAAALNSQNRALEFSFLLMLPAATGLIVLAEPIMIVLFQRGQFGVEEARASAAALAAYASGLPAYLLIKALTPGFYAREDTATPVKVAAVCAVLHVALSVALMIPFLHVGIALSTALAAWFNAAALAWLLYRRGHLRPDARLTRRLPRMVVACVAMAGALWLAGGLLADTIAASAPERVAALAALIACGAVAFAVAVLATGAATLKDVKGLVRRKSQT
jgi:putative peptidoglycan lipid II flippase